MSGYDQVSTPAYTRCSQVHRAAAPTLTSTWPGRGSGMATSSNSMWRGAVITDRRYVAGGAEMGGAGATGACVIAFLPGRALNGSQHSGARWMNGFDQALRGRRGIVAAPDIAAEGNT